MEMVEIPVKEILRRTEGWLELGCPEEALKELEGLPDSYHATREVLKLKCQACHVAGDWAGLFALADCCMKYYPRERVFSVEKAVAQRNMRARSHRADESSAAWRETFPSDTEF